MATEAMRAHYIGVWRLAGATSLAVGDSSYDVAKQKASPARERIVGDPEPYFAFLDCRVRSASFSYKALCREPKWA